MILRKLAIKDVDSMLIWMKDQDITQYFRENFETKTRHEIESFINESFTDTNQHFAISTNTGKYLGTISLKNINFFSRNAEYAIVLSRESIGHDIAKIATDMILTYAFSILKLEKVYFNVISNNIRAINFYHKYGFIYEGKFIRHVMLKGELRDLEWYSIFKNEHFAKKLDFADLLRLVKY
jgi:diamine N-acetyltransferase